MKGWFDAFRDDGAPTLYSFSNRTPVIGDVSLIVVSILFATLYTAFLVIFPGVRKQVIIVSVIADANIKLNFLLFNLNRCALKSFFYCKFVNLILCN